MARVWPAWLGLTATLAITSVAAAARERAFALSWSAPAECPDEATMDGYVEADVGAPAFGPTVVRARGTVSPVAEGRYSVELELQLDASGAPSNRRELVGSSCESVSQAAALLVALAIRAGAAPAAVPAPRAERPIPPPAPSSHERPFLAAELLTDLGSLPEPTVGLGIAGGLTFSAIRFEPAVAYFARQSGNVAGSPGLGARLTLGTATVRACLPFPRSELWVAPCVGGGVDWTVARGFGAQTPRTASTFDAIGTAALLGGWDVSSIISLRLEIGAALPFGRPVFEVDDVGDVYRRAPLALRSAFGLELHF